MHDLIGHGSYKETGGRTPSGVFCGELLGGDNGLALGLAVFALFKVITGFV
jgi:hypothetical protein